MNSRSALWGARGSRIFFIIALIGVLGLAFLDARSGRGQTLVVEGAPLLLGGPEVISAESGGHALPLEVREDGERISVRIRPAQSGPVLIGRSSEPKAVTQSIFVVPAWHAYLSMFSVLCLLITLPFVFSPLRLAHGRGAWANLLTDPDGSYSLSRVQLLIWFMPAAVIFGGVSLASTEFMPISSQLAILLGLSGATAFLGSAANPSGSQSPASAVAPRLSDLVEDFSQRGDVSRYQYLVLSIVGGSVLLVGFIHSMELPDIPSQMLLLVAASQGTYVATKAVKSIKLDDGFVTGGSARMPESRRLAVGTAHQTPYATSSALAAPDGSFAKRR